MNKSELEYLKDQLKEHEENLRLSKRHRNTLLIEYRKGSVNILRQIIRKFS